MPAPESLKNLCYQELVRQFLVGFTDEEYQRHRRTMTQEMQLVLKEKIIAQLAENQRIYERQQLREMLLNEDVDIQILGIVVPPELMFYLNLIYANMMQNNYPNI